MDVTPIASETLHAARALLAANELPIDDLEDPAIHLLGAIEGGALLGVIGLQVCGRAGLLRSLAVSPAARGRGIARALCDRVFLLAAQQGLDGLWLLTTSARDYFARHGFDEVARDRVPPAIRATAQFTSLCPSSAVVMRR